MVGCSTIYQTMKWLLSLTLTLLISGCGSDLQDTAFLARRNAIIPNWLS